MDQTTATNNGVPALQWLNFVGRIFAFVDSGQHEDPCRCIGHRRLAFDDTNGSTFTAGAHLNGAFGNAAGNVSNLLPAGTRRSR